MSDPPPQGIAGTVAAVGKDVVHALPAQFLALLLINAVFILTFLWFLDREEAGQRRFEQAQLESRERMMIPLLSACMADLPPQGRGTAGGRPLPLH